MDLSSSTWRKSSYSGDNGAQCVEVADSMHATVLMRDSKNPAGPALVFSHTDWRSFIAGIKARGLDV